ncbi:hypothetical protein LIER_17510 [Lithospermum erythrorhizon]|uniref:Reverse transcriptase domain-containing protein n=1 Tax=Lithospermum erythrorhizon TaxID=34254 RepID=A0AAV3QCZ0_LITER
MSDHTPLLLECVSQGSRSLGGFKFQQMWLRHEGFYKLVEDSWALPVYGAPIFMFWMKLKRMKALLKSWNREIAKGDRNIGFFHNVTKKKRSKATIQGTLVDDDWVKDKVEIASSGVDFFRELFADDEGDQQRALIDYIPLLVSQDDNDFLMSMPELVEVKDVVFSLNKQSVGVRMGLMVISKALSSRLANILPGIILDFQEGFVPSRQIEDNILLARELLHKIGYKKVRKTRGNVILNLDMAKAFDKVSWGFLKPVLQCFSFADVWIDRVIKCLSNSWFSVLINGELPVISSPIKGYAFGIPCRLPYLSLLRSIFFGGWLSCSRRIQS